MSSEDITVSLLRLTFKIVLGLTLVVGLGILIVIGIWRAR